MSPLPIPTPPPDASGGFFVLQYANGTDTHRARVHVLPFSTTKFIIGGGTPSVDNDDGSHDYAYQPDRTAGMESGISDTFQAYVNVIKPYFAASWVFTLASLYKINAGVPTEIFPVPNVSPIAGSNNNPAPTGVKRALELIFNLRTAGGRRARFVMIAPNNNFVEDVPQVVSPTIGGANDKALMAYLISDGTAIVGHDGQKLQSQGHLTTVYNRRLRRHYGYA